MTKIFTLKFISLAMLCLAFGSAQVFAQSTVTGGINGRVTDPQDAVIPNASVTATNLGTNAAVTVTATDNGDFRFNNLQPGTYKVETTVSGFATATAEQVVVEVGQSTQVNFQLQVSGADVQVEVVAEAPVINTTDNSNATNINQTSINELPINGRRWSNFALLTPGAVPDGTFGLISFRGVSGLLNNNTIDGGDNNQAFFSEERGRTRINYSISQAAIREFQVNTSNYSAEYGRSAGGVTNAVTKSGTNEFHGEIFYYNRNNRNGARNPLATLTLPSGEVVGIKPVDLRQQWGGTIGGPIIKDRLFFFFSYDQQKRNFPGLARFSTTNFLNSADVECLTAPIGTTLPPRPPINTSPCPGKGLTLTQINNTRSFLLSLTGETPRKGDQTLFLPKIDWQINDNNLFSISYNRLRWDSPNGIQTQATNTRSRSNFGDDFVDIDSVNARLQSTLSPNILNEFRIQYGRDFESQISAEPLPGEPITSSTAAAGPRAPNVFIQNGIEFGTPTFLERPAFPNETRWQFADTVTWTRGRHTIKFGGDINRVNDDIQNLRFEAGAFSYTGGQAINDFIIDYVNWVTPLDPNTPCANNSARRAGRCYVGNYNQGVGSPGTEFSTWDYNFFVQDDFRINPRLTVNLGLRWEYISLPEPFLPNTNTTGLLAASNIIPNDGRTIGEATANLPDDKNNFGPRIGLAYDLFGDGRTSVRAGYGIYFGRIQNSTIYNALVNTGNPGGQSQLIISPTTTINCFPIVPTATNACAPIFPNVIPASDIFPEGAIQYFSEDFQAPKIHQYDFIIEHQLMKNTVVSASYIGSLGRNLPTFYDLNNARTGQTTYTVTNGPAAGEVFTLPLYTRVYQFAGSSNGPAMTRIQSTVKSEYNALVLKGERRFTDGLQFQASYTLASSRDTNQNSATFTQTNSPYDILDGSYDRGPSNFDTRHRFVASAVWSPNFWKGTRKSFGNYVLNGWTVSPIFNYFSGRPFNATVGGTSLNGSFGSNHFPVFGRNSERLPSLTNIDLRLSKRFRMTESIALEVLGEAFNLFNSTHIFGVNSTLYNRSGTNLNLNNGFGAVTGTDSTLFRERQIQFAARLQF